MKRTKQTEGRCTPDQRRFIMGRLNALRPNRYGYIEDAPTIPKPQSVVAAEREIERLEKIVKAHEKREERAREVWKALQISRIASVERAALFAPADEALATLIAYEDRRAQETAARR